MYTSTQTKRDLTNEKEMKVAHFLFSPRYAPFVT